MRRASSLASSWPARRLPRAYGFVPRRRFPAGRVDGRVRALPIALFAALVVASASSCGGSRQGAVPVGPFHLEDDRARLVLPPTQGTAEALARIRAAAGRGDLAASWAATHYLIDLFDYARFSTGAHRAAARRLLAAATGVPEGTGPTVTDRVLDALLVEVDRVAAIERLHPGAQAGRILLDFERRPPEDRAALLAGVLRVKTVARGGGPLAANATLRLATLCRRAFRDATRAPVSHRARMLAICLYPLYDSDPDPYFADDPTRRPPEPDWRDLAARVRQLLEAIAASGSRIAPLGRALAAEDERFFARATRLLPDRPDPRALRVPRVDRAEAYDWTPLLPLVDGSRAASVAELARTLEEPLRQDRRGRVTLVLSADAPASALVHGVEAAYAAGAITVELAVGFSQPLQVPEGDYWHGRVEGGAIERLGVLPLSLTPLAESRRQKGEPLRGEDRRDAPRAGKWQPARASLELHLVVGADAWRLVAPAGEFSPLSSRPGAEPVAELREQLGRVRRAYPDEDGLLVFAEEGATVGAVARAAAAARWDEHGAPLFAALAVALTRPTPRAGGDLLARIDRRASADVRIAPSELSDRTPLARRCYLDALERAPKLRGTVVLERGDELDPVKVVSGPKDATLRGCLIERLGPAIREGRVRNAKVELVP